MEKLELKNEMTNVEAKKANWEKIKSKYSHLENIVKIELVDIDEDSRYYHPKFIFDDDNFIKGQCDVNTKYIYALNFVFDKVHISICEDFLTEIILSYQKNKIFAIEIMKLYQSIINEVDSIKELAGSYFLEAFKSNVISEVTDILINKIRITAGLVESLKKMKGY